MSPTCSRPTLFPRTLPCRCTRTFPGTNSELLVERIGTGLLSQSLEERVSTLTRIEEAEPRLFDRLRDFVYYVYYGHPTVVSLIRTKTRFGGDYLGGGQPEGYVDSLETWGERSLTARGAFFPTDAVLRAPQAKEQA